MTSLLTLIGTASEFVHCSSKTDANSSAFLGRWKLGDHYRLAAFGFLRLPKVLRILQNCLGSSLVLFIVVCHWSSLGWWSMSFTCFCCCWSLHLSSSLRNLYQRCLVWFFVRIIVFVWWRDYVGLRGSLVLGLKIWLSALKFLLKVYPRLPQCLAPSSVGGVWSQNWGLDGWTYANEFSFGLVSD